MVAIFIAVIVEQWGFSDTWWRRQVALMILLSFCTLARGAAITSCLCEGLSWVRKDGSQPRNPNTFVSVQHCRAPDCSHPGCVRGFLLLFPARKNRRNSPSWLPVAERSAVSMMANYVRWLRSLPQAATCSQSESYLRDLRKPVRRPSCPIKHTALTCPPGRSEPSSVRPWYNVVVSQSSRRATSAPTDRVSAPWKNCAGAVFRQKYVSS